MTFDRRAYAREWQRKRRAAALAERQGGSLVCQARPSRWAVCGGRLEFTSDGRGGVVARCPRCARRKAGVCRDCPRRVAGTPGRALYCAACRRAAARREQRRYRDAHREAVNAKAAERQRRRRASGLRALYEIVREHERPDTVRKADRRQAIRGHARVKGYAQRWAADVKAGRRTPQPLPRAADGRRLCIGPYVARGTCAAPVAGRARKCAACKRADVAAARTLLTRAKARAKEQAA